MIFLHYLISFMALFNGCSFWELFRFGVSLDALATLSNNRFTGSYCHRFPRKESEYWLLGGRSGILKLPLVARRRQVFLDVLFGWHRRFNLETPRAIDAASGT